MQELSSHDLRYVVERLPRDVRKLLSDHPRRLFVGGGFIRATIAGEVPSDIDMFGDNAEWLLSVAHALVAVRPGARLHATKNAITVITPNRLTVQFITRWVFGNAADLIASFDFTVCQAAIWRHGRMSNDMWCSAIGNRFYQDLAARRLTYTSPERDEEAGGSMLRVIKYVKRGYSIQVASLGAVISRLAEHPVVLGHVDKKLPIADLLREVDPSLVVDGLEIVDDHKPVEGFPAA